MPRFDGSGSEFAKLRCSEWLLWAHTRQSHHDGSRHPGTQGAQRGDAAIFSEFPHANDNTVGYGVNFQGYQFKGPIAKNNDWYIARVDYRLNASGTHTLYWRGGLRNDTRNDVPYLPGTPPLRNLV